MPHSCVYTRHAGAVRRRTVGDGPRPRLGDLLSARRAGDRKNYMWIHDFLDDEVVITEDLFDVLSAFPLHLVLPPEPRLATFSHSPGRVD